jgi:D-glycero-D-manno-heptose 1,7-bisphosphate phosphatase
VVNHITHTHGEVLLKPAIFLDRDGTINKELNYLHDPELFELLPGAAETIAEWNKQGWLVVLVTNQAGVGRGYFPISAVQAVHKRMNERLSERGARLDGIYVCPHSPDDGCACRKPKTFLFETAAKEIGIALKRSYIIGDKLTDVLPARDLGARAILVRTGYGAQQLKSIAQYEGFTITVAADLPDAARIIENERLDSLSL